ncbi:DUF1801 domain-containing protein [Neolewinella persica]|uniref:DUF1801 domain-containing protein n=1 Tax=Neolewinella persica TaxID=70998 RepID=UPI000379E731|nr:DUF1801 domain-containing protein [Neolewinella persica]
MAKQKNKTQPTDVLPADFIAGVEDEQKRQDAEWVLKMMEEVTGEPAKMWGPSIIGFGSYRYVYPSGREGDWMLTGFSPRKTALSIYLMSGVEREKESLEKLGKHKLGKSCLYLKKLSDVDTDVLQEMVVSSVQKVREGDIRY